MKFIRNPYRIFDKKRGRTVRFDPTLNQTTNDKSGLKQQLKRNSKPDTKLTETTSQKLLTTTTFFQKNLLFTNTYSEYT
jgi:hypothetical protein